MILLSIVIPCFNEEKYIKHCLESITKQNEFHLGRIEIIIVNDGSTDNSQNIISFFVQKHSNVRLINTSNNGLAMSRNIGILYSLGEYIMFIDGDDWIVNDCLRDIVNIASIDSPDVITGLVEGMPNAGITRRYNDPDIKNIKLNEKAKSLLMDMHISGIKMTPAWKYIFKKKIAISNKLFFQNLLHEDYLWSPLLLCYAQTYKFYPKYFYKYRLTNDGLSLNYSLSAANDCLLICNNLFSIASNFQEEKKQFLYHRCSYLLNRISHFALNFTQEENQLLKHLMHKYDNMISFCENYQ